ncbi:MAG: sulfotransferase [Actinomycetota bacterium]|nr:sulfotransferase [Actinomycetota bacterium]
MTDRKPNFIHIGPGKTGSTWLHEVLIRHEQIFMTEAKDLYFFDRYFDRGMDWYLAQFKAARPQHKIIGEVCQHYLFSADAPKRIHDCLPEARLMLTLREPAARAFSSYLYQSKHGAVTGTFRAALDTRPGILNSSRYASHLKRYLEYFDRSAIYVGLFDDLSKNPQGFIDPLLAWLDVEPMTLDEDLIKARLPASSARSTRLARTVRDTADWARRRNAAGVVGRIKRSALVHKALYKPLGGSSGSKPTMSTEDAQFVRDELDAEIAELEVLLGMDLRKRWNWPQR